VAAAKCLEEAIISKKGQRASLTRNDILRTRQSDLRANKKLRFFRARGSCQHLITFFIIFFLSISGSLIKSQFPVFTIYAQKSCLKMRPCERAWCIDRVQGYALKDHIKRSATAMSRQDCYEMCFGETDFLCR
jgi:hypothetical protein